MRTLILGTLALMAVSCCHFSGQCKNTPVQQAVVDCSKVAWHDVAAAVDAALRSGDWKAALDDLALKAGPDVVGCAVTHWLSDQQVNGAAMDVEPADHAHQWLAGKATYEN